MSNPTPPSNPAPSGAPAQQQQQQQQPAEQVPYIGCRISLISHRSIRYEGTLYTIDAVQHSVALENVIVMGTENRAPPQEFVPPSSEVYSYIVFRSDEIKDLLVRPEQPRFPPQGYPGYPQQPGYGYGPQPGYGYPPQQQYGYNPNAQGGHGQPQQGQQQPPQASKPAPQNTQAPAPAPKKSEGSEKKAEDVDKLVESVNKLNVNEGKENTSTPSAPVTQTQGQEDNQPKDEGSEQPDNQSSAPVDPAFGALEPEKAQRDSSQNAGRGRGDRGVRGGRNRARGAGKGRDNRQQQNRTDSSQSSPGTGSYIRNNWRRGNKPSTEQTNNTSADNNNASDAKTNVDSEYDFQKANAKFAESQAGPMEGGNQGNDSALGNDLTEARPKIECQYDAKKSFFDTLSSTRDKPMYYREERQLNSQTFGDDGANYNRRQNRGRYRGRRNY